jgi:hypothetical protein
MLKKSSKRKIQTNAKILSVICFFGTFIHHEKLGGFRVFAEAGSQNLKAEMFSVSQKKRSPEILIYNKLYMETYVLLPCLRLYTLI